MRRVAVLVVVAALTACVSARDCATSLPDALRADVIRFVIDQGLCEGRLIPHDDVVLGLSLGTPYDRMTEDRRRELARYAAGYASCIREHVDRL